MADPLAQQRQWYSYFPEGTLEFLVVTRVLAIILVGALVIVPTNQRAIVGTAIAGIVWCDYALLMWWLVQLARDLHDAFALRPQSIAGTTTFADSTILAYADSQSLQQSRVGDLLRQVTHVAILFAPSIFALGFFTPWAPRSLARGHMLIAVKGTCLIAFLITLPSAYRALRRCGLPMGIWTLLMLVPGAHFLALHRLLAFLHNRVRDRALERQLPVSQVDGAGAAAGAADIFAITTILFSALWAVLLFKGISRGIGIAFVQAATIGSACLLAITEVAATEFLQRRFVALLRRSQPVDAAVSQEKQS